MLEKLKNTLSKWKVTWISHSFVICYSLLFVFCYISIADTKFSTRMTESKLQAYENGIPSSLAPSNLKRIPEHLRLSLQVESRDFPTEQLTQTKAWSELQNTLAEYARRLDFIEEQNRLWERRDMKRSDWFLYLTLACVFGLLILDLSDRENRKINHGKIHKAVTTTHD